MTLAKYVEYKDSGAEWLGKAPAHWSVDRLKWSVASCKNGVWGDDPKGDHGDILCIRVADFDRTRLTVKLDKPTIRNLTLSEQSRYLLQPGDLLLEKSGGGENQPVGCVVLFDHVCPAVYANFIARMRPAKQMCSSYWRYVHSAGYDIGLNIPSIKQTSGIQNLDQKSYLDELAPFPPYEEQNKISSFLDHETAKLDALIKEQQRLIGLLKEKRQAVISHAVTKGLDPEAPLKDSGVEWLGEVPAHWNVCRITHHLSSIVDYRGKTPQKDETGVFLVTAKNIRDGRVDYEASREYITQSAYQQVIQRGLPKVGDVVFTTEAPLGEVANLDRDDVALAQRVIKFRGVPDVVNNYFLKYWIMGRFCQSQLESRATGSTALGIKGSKINGSSRFCVG